MGLPPTTTTQPTCWAPEVVRELPARDTSVLPVAIATPATERLIELGANYTLHAYEHDPRSGSYGAEAAAALGVATQRLFKTLIAAADGRLVCAVVPVSGQLSLKALAGAVGAKRAELAEHAAASRATGYVVGGISPIGQKTALPVLIDESAVLFDTVFVSAGRRGLQVELAPDELVRAVGATYAPIATE